MTNPSCLNCAFGMTEKQAEGFYCNIDPPPNRFNMENREYFRLYDWGAGRDPDDSPCSCHKPRQNKCEIDGCKWMDKGKCESPRDRTGLTIAPNPIFNGKDCHFFEKQEETMEKIKVNGKTYEQVCKPVLTLRNLFDDAKNCSDASWAIWKFSKDFQFFDYHDKITLTPRIITYINQHPGIIPWLLEKGYLRVVVVEEKQLPNQWYKGLGETKNYYFSDEHCQLTRVFVGEGILGRCFGPDSWPAGLTKIDPPLITEQSDTAERKPELCVHNEGLRCQIRLKTGHGHCENTAYTDCPGYTPK